MSIGRWWICECGQACADWQDRCGFCRRDRVAVEDDDDDGGASVEAGAVDLANVWFVHFRERLKRRRDG